jgi:hypothetical protein
LVAHILARWPERMITAGFGGSGVRETDEKLAEQAKALDPQGVDPEQDEARKKLLTWSNRDNQALEAVTKGRQAKPSTAPALDLTKAPFPVLAVNGEYDSPVSKTQRMARELRDFRNVIVPRRAHNSMTIPGHIPQAYIDAIASFIRANDP